MSSRPAFYTIEKHINFKSILWVVCVPARSGFLRKILKKREKVQTPEDGDFTMTQALAERSAEGT